MGAEKAVFLMARLTTKGLQPGMMFGGIPELSRTDIAAACAKLPPLQFHLVMAKYCDDVESVFMALAELQAVMIARNPIWKEMEPRRRTCITASMLDEFVAAKRCRRCKGTAEVVEEKKVVTCKSCSGTGHLIISESSRARSCGIPKTTFREHGLMKPFSDIMWYLADIEMSALSYISRKAS
jgi:hypothetical protein